MLISTVCLLVCVCARKMLGGTSETNYWQSFGNSYPITGALSLTALWENQPPNPATEKKELLLSSVANELAPACALFFPPLPVCIGVSALTTDRLHGEAGEGFDDKVVDNTGKASRMFANRVVGVMGTRFSEGGAFIRTFSMATNSFDYCWSTRY